MRIGPGEPFAVAKRYVTPFRAGPACPARTAPRAFADEPVDPWLREVSADLAAGRLDDELVYRRRDADVVMTRSGLEPAGALTAPIDHDHYFVKQLAPVCDVLLPFLGTSFERIAGPQTTLF